MADAELERLRAIVLGLPEVTERFSHGAPCFYVRDRRALCYFHDEEYDDRLRPSVMCPAETGQPEELTVVDPHRFYQPNPSSSGTFSDWVGVYLDTDHPSDWAEVTTIIRAAYRLVAPRQLAAMI